jgi:hypothetical protein
MLGSSSVASQLAASQEGLSSIDKNENDRKMLKTHYIKILCLKLFFRKQQSI